MLCVCMNKQVRMLIGVHSHVCVCVCASVHVHVCVSVCMHECVCVRVRARTCATYWFLTAKSFSLLHSPKE